MNSVLKDAVKTVIEIPVQEASADIWDKKYRLKAKDGTILDQTVDDTWKRVAQALSKVEEPGLREVWYEKFLWALRHGAIPAGRITSNAGAREHKPATSTINCTVSGTIRDSMDDILNKVHEAGLTLKAGCVAAGTWVRTERGLVKVEDAVTESHREILSYDRETQRFEMRPILEHRVVTVPRSENIEIVANGVSLKTSVKHPVLVYRDGALLYVRADEVRREDALVQHCLTWSADAKAALHAWFAGAHLGDGSAYENRMDYKPTGRAWARRAQILGQRLVFKVRAAEREVVERYAQFFSQTLGTDAKVMAAVTVNGTPVWDYTVASFNASRAAALIDHQTGSKSATLRVPGWIRTEPEKYFLPFLAGLLDTDGTVSREHGSAILATCNLGFAQELKSLLGLFGVHGAITVRQAQHSHLLNGREVHDGGVMLKISDSAFLLRVAAYMADSGKRARIVECASQSGQYDQYRLPKALSAALTNECSALNHTERQTLGFYHGYHLKETVNRIWLDRWELRFPHLKSLIALARSLRPVDTIRRQLDLNETFYDFHVEGHNNYLAGNNGLVVIHNCGIGYEFSTLRPRGAYVAGAGAYTSGPMSFMDIYDKMCFTVSSAGGRRGAQMGTFDVGHPDVMDFIRAKRENGRLRQFNLSLLVTHDFMEAVKADGEWPLAFPLRQKEAEADHIDINDNKQVIWREWPVTDGYVVNAAGQVACKVYKIMHARHLFNAIMASTYDYAEPGFVLIDKVNEMNNNWWCENIRATNPCVTADTRLHTQYGLVRIGDLYANGVPLEVTVDRRALGESGPGTTVRSAKPAFMTAPQADVYRVVTEDGYEIKATEWHDFYTQRGKIKLRDLKPGDQLLVQSGKGQFGHEGSKELGLLLGLITGDGHFTNRGKGQQAAVINFWGQDQTLADQVCQYVNALIANTANHIRNDTTRPVAVPERNMVFIRSVLLARILERFGFTAASKLRVPEVIWRGSEECVKAYLRALFQADGTVNISGNGMSCSIRLASSYPSLLKDVQMLLANIGVFCRIRLRHKASARVLPDGKGGHKAYACKDDCELIVDGESRDVFMREVGFLLDYKNHKYSEWVKDKSLKQHRKFVSRVGEIIFTGREAVFDTTQPDHNAVIFNGVVTGQCGEQPLPKYGACLLGSVNLTQFVRDPFTDHVHFDWDEYRDVVRVFTRMLDDVVDINGLPLPRQREEILRKRRHGMGYLGLGSTLTLLGMKYGSPESVKFTEDVSREMAVAGWEQALELAKEKGPAPIMLEEFEVTPEMLAKRPEMKRDGWKIGDKIKGKDLHASYSRYMQRLAGVAPDLVEQLAKTGARFTHHTSIAPTGTISLSLANNASNGIEPSFAHHYFRNVIREGRKTKEKIGVYSFELLAYRALVNPQAMPDSEKPEEKLPEYFITADNITPREHVDIQAAAQKWVDSSISKTANVPTDYPYEDFKNIYLYAYERGLKGCTTFRFNPAAFQGVLVREQDLKNTVYKFTLEDGTVIEAHGDEEIEYDGEMHTAANLFDAIKEGYFGKF
ncbi:MAG: LAGLIDADG family homing endonuclease [Gammaproteobacteria bacterium]